MNYQIQILSDEEFESLPYEECSISLGLADTNKNTAYVRYIANEELQKHLINHELEHLIGSDRDEIHHDGKGVYYKGFGNIFSALGSGLSNIASGIGQGAGQVGMNIGRSIGNAASSAGSGISNLAGSASKAMGFGGGFQGGQNPSGGMAAAAAANPSLRMPTQPQFSGGGGTFRGVGASGSWGPSMPSAPSLGSKSMTTQSIPIGAKVDQQAPSPSQTSQDSQGFDLFGNLSKGLGLGQQVMSMFGNKSGGGMAQMSSGGGSRLPDLSQLPSVQAYKNFNFRGNLQQLDPALQDAVNRDFDRIDAQEEHEFRNQWKNIRPGADIENDSVFARDYQELKRSQGLRRADALAKYRLENIQTQLGVNEMEARRLQELAQLDVDTISFNTGLDAQQAMQLKLMAGYGDSSEGSTEDTLGNISNIVGQVGNIMGGFK